MTQHDIAWAVAVLARRSAALVPYAPLYWRPARDASERHHDFLAYVIGEGQGFGFRTDDALLIAAKGRHGWTIDDAWVQPDRWEWDGLELWNRMAAQLDGEVVRFVCPAFEPERRSFAHRRGLVLANSWWHIEVRASPTAGALDPEPRVVGSSATLVPAPPVFDPGGPVLYLRDVHDVTAITRSREEAARCGSQVVVVEQPAGAAGLARALDEGGFTRHCDFLVGAVRRTAGLTSRVADLEE